MTNIHKKLHDASSAGDDTLVRELLAAGAEPDKYKDSWGDSALSEAARWGRDSTVSILLQAGANLNIQNDNGRTALHRAAYNGHNEVTTTLIKAGADLNLQNKDGKTALHYAAAGYNEVTITLIEAGADPYLQDNEGRTPVLPQNKEIAR